MLHGWFSATNQDLAQEANCLAGRLGLKCKQAEEKFSSFGTEKPPA
jgi:hypothetical protein